MTAAESDRMTQPLAEAAAEAKAMRETIEALCLSTSEYVKKRVAASQRWKAPAPRAH